MFLFLFLFSSLWDFVASPVDGIDLNHNHSGFSWWNVHRTDETCYHSQHCKSKGTGNRKEMRVWRHQGKGGSSRVFILQKVGKHNMVCVYWMRNGGIEVTFEELRIVTPLCTNYRGWEALLLIYQSRQSIDPAQSW